MNVQARIVSGYIPKYRQLVDILRNRILSGEYSPGARMPTEEDLSSTYAVSRGTVRKAIAQLEAERLVYTEQGIGSFVQQMHPRAVPFRLLDPYFVEQSLTHEVVAREVIAAPLEVAERLRVSPGEPVVHIARRRLCQGRIVAYTVRYLPQALCPTILEEDLTVQSVHALLVRNSELPLLRAEVEIEAHRLTADEAQLLEDEVGILAIVVDRLTYTAPNRPAVWYRGLFRHAYHLGVELEEEVW